MWLQSPALHQIAGDSHFMKASLSYWLPISYLLHRDIMSSEDNQVEVHQLQDQLNDLQNEISATKCPCDDREQACSEGLQKSDGNQEPILSNPGSSLHNSSSDEGFHMRELYFLAISLLLAKIAWPKLTAEAPSITSITKTALFHLHNVRFDLPCLLWAITLIGIAATSSEDRS